MSDKIVHLTIIHFNDVYEIIPVSGGTLGGLARVAALRAQLVAENPNTMVFFGGDLYNPSGIGMAVVDGERLDGKQTVATMNKVGIDYMTFGDHELNTVTRAQLDDRLAATQSKIVSSNLFDVDGTSFTSGDTTVLEHDIFTVSNAAGDTLRVGVFGITKPIRLSKVDHVYQNRLEAATTQVSALRDQVDFLIALTHQPIERDQEQAAELPEIDLILGGDDHNHMYVETGAGPPIFKADSNARSVYVLDLYYDSVSGETEIKHHLQPITDALPDDLTTATETTYWVDLAFDSFRRDGWEPTEIIAHAVQELDGFEGSVRNGNTAYTDAITQGMMRIAPGTELAIVCSWAVRLDDSIPAGSAITHYDLLRTFSYGNTAVYAVQMPGDLLEEVLNFGQDRVGAGWFLLTPPQVKYQDGDQDNGGERTWSIAGQPLDQTRSYLVAMGDDLLYDCLQFINEPRSSEVVKVGTYTDISDALIQQLRADEQMSEQHSNTE